MDGSDNEPYSYRAGKETDPDPGKIDLPGQKIISEEIDEKKYHKDIYEAVVFPFQNIPY